MRPVLHGDAIAAARALKRRPADERGPALALMLARAEAADAFRIRFGRAHPAWGNGSLMALVGRETLPAEPPLDDPDYCRCLSLVYGVLAEWSQAHAASCGRS